MQVGALSGQSAQSATTADGLVEKLGQAHLASVSPFSGGFSAGFIRGSSLTAIGSANEKASLSTSSLLSGTGNMLTHLTTSSNVSANGIVEKLGISSLQSTTSLAGNSVLLIGGLSELLGSSILSGTLLNPLENNDQVGFTLYIDRGRDLSLYIDKVRGFDGYIDKQKLETLYTEKQSSSNLYIDKQKDFSLARER